MPQYSPAPRENLRVDQDEYGCECAGMIILKSGAPHTQKGGISKFVNAAQETELWEGGGGGFLMISTLLSCHSLTHKLEL